MEIDERRLHADIRKAVEFFWETRVSQKSKSTVRDSGSRTAATGGKQMDGFIELITKMVVDSKCVGPSCIFTRARVELPGYFRPTKQWDLLIVKDKILIAAIELKSHPGPSFGNNFNNRVEEALGSAVDIWTAFREGAFKITRRPWLGYLMLLEDCPQSSKPVSVAEPHFDVLEEFRNASYMERYRLLCRKLVRERHYDSATLITSADSASGHGGEYNEPDMELTFHVWIQGLLAHIDKYR